MLPKASVTFKMPVVLVPFTSTAWYVACCSIGRNWEAKARGASSLPKLACRDEHVFLCILVLKNLVILCMDLVKVP